MKRKFRKPVVILYSSTFMLSLCCAFYTYYIYSQTQQDSLLLENIEAVTADAKNTTENKKPAPKKDPVYCYTEKSKSTSGGCLPDRSMAYVICDNGHAPLNPDGKKTCKELQSPKCTSTLTDYGSGTSIVAYCIPIN